MITKELKNYRERQKKLNRERKEYYVTEAEHKALKYTLKELRKVKK